MRKRQENIWLGEVYENTYQLFLYITMKYLHKREDAEEIVHDVYVKWGENSEKYKGKSLDEMKSLGIIIIKNACIDLIRARERHPETPVEINEELLGEDDDALSNLIEQEKCENVRRSIKLVCG